MRDDQSGLGNVGNGKRDDACKRNSVDQSSPEPENSCKPRLFQPPHPQAPLVSEHMNQASIQHRPANSGPSSSANRDSDNNGQAREIRVRLGEIFPLLADAMSSQRTWLEDFADDEIAIPVDLHDVLEAYRNFWSDAA